MPAVAPWLKLTLLYAELERVKVTRTDFGMSKGCGGAQTKRDKKAYGRLPLFKGEFRQFL